MRTPVRVYKDREIFRRLAAETRPYRPHIAGIFVISMLAAPLTLLTPVPLAIAVDSVIGTQPLPGFLDPLVPAGVSDSKDGVLILVAFMFLAIAVLAQVQDLANSILKTYTGERLLLNFRSKLFQQSQRLSFAYHDKVGTSDSTYRVQEDAKSLQYIAVESLISLVTAATTLAAMIYITARIDFDLALVAVGVSPLLLLTARHFRPRMRATSREVKQLESGALSVVQEVLTGLRLVKAFGAEDREHERFFGQSRLGMRARVRLRLIEGGYAVLVATLIGAGSSVVLFVGVRHVQRGTITLGELLLVMGYLTQLYAPIKTMARKAGSLQNYLASAERAFALLEEVPDVPERPHARAVTRAAGAVEFRDVSFAYDADRLALQNISFAVAPGARVGIAGATGAGKTTLMNLLTRFYDPQSGQILLDGVDLRDYRLADLRNQFGIVLQDPVLFSTSIAENIAYARPHAGQREIEEAAAAANIDEFILRLPEQYDTPVGERGMRLSGGERQRISLARAFLKDAPILILDEPTSAVDVETERLIMEAMERLMSGRTSFMIAHRLSTLDACDTRIEIEHGRLVEVAPASRAGKRAARAKARPIEIEPQTQPVLAAWSRLHPDAEPRAITLLNSHKRKRKSDTFRLEGCAPDGTSVIAKRSRRSTAEFERTVYERVLAELPVASLRWFGMADEGEDACWLFLEDAGDVRYSPLVDEHRRLAAAWLAALHSAAAKLPEVARLPDRGPDHYLEHLRSARKAVRRQISERAVAGEELRVLARLLSQFDALESCWGDVTALCDALPRTLVHGDFSRKNVRVRAGASGLTLAAFDWEKAGWGVPAADLACLRPDQRKLAADFRESGVFGGFCADPTQDVYAAVLRNGSRQPTTETVERMATVGTLFRCLATVNWQSSRFTAGWTPLTQLDLCSEWLEDAARLTAPRRRVTSGDAELRQTVERALVRAGRTTSPPAAIHRRQFEGETSYAVEIVTAELDSGQTIDIFMKDFGRSKLPKDAVAARRERERRVYDDLLHGKALGTARFYGAQWDEGAGHHRLLLEFVDGKPLRHCGFEHWLAAAAWLGRLHGCFADQQDRLAECAFLLRHDAGFFASAAERAVAAVSELPTAFGQRLDEVLGGYERVIATMTQGAGTLVHGSFRPQNVLVVRSCEPPRVCPTDWELAALGCSAYDLAFLCDGFRGGRLDALLDSYERAARRSGAPVRARAELQHEVDCFRLHKTIGSLGHLRQWERPAQTSAKVLAAAEEIADRLSPARARARTTAAAGR
jgi:ATP-binding cassette, subfamily B, bacterial